MKKNIIGLEALVQRVNETTLISLLYLIEDIGMVSTSHSLTKSTLQQPTTKP